MNSHTQHPMDEIIDRDISGLRQPVASMSGAADAILTMQQMPPTNRRLGWPIGVGSVAIGAGAIILITSLTTTTAYAGELREIAAAQSHQVTKYQKSFMYRKGSDKPYLTLEMWTDHDKEAIRQYEGDGKLEVATVSDGKRTYFYFAGNAQMKPSATVRSDTSPHFSIETIDAMLKSDFFRQRKIVKSTGVKLGGKTCDYYNFANGYYRLWIDPVTKLPLQREIYDKGVTLWKRDVYQYPASFNAATFTPYEVAGLPYVEMKSTPLGNTQKAANVKKRAQATK